VGGCGLSDYYGEDKEALQENILLAPWSKYSNFMHTVCLGSGTIQ
jgi:hypothetical protein